MRQQRARRLVPRRARQESFTTEAIMYAVIRAGGKQYRVAPGDVIRIEKVAPAQGKDAGQMEFTEVLAISGEQGSIARPQAEARVTGQVLGEGRGEKILVFHYKRKKQYKRLRGHRQPFTEVRITEIAFDGQKFTAPELAGQSTPKARQREAAPPAAKAKKPGQKTAKASGPAEGAGGRTAATRHAGSTKTTGTKSKGGKPPAPRKRKK
jgi:large subunit ribosomal protein L21